MKKSLLLSALLGAAPIFAAPMYYTLTGKIILIPQDQGGYAAAHGIAVGNTFSYIFVVDTAQAGVIIEKGAVGYRVDTVNTGTGYRADYFFDSLVTPSLFSAAITDSSNGVFYGFQTATKIGTSALYNAAFQTIIGDSHRETQVLINLKDTSATDFLPKVGATLSATELYADSSGATSSAALNLTVAAISATKPSSGVLPRAAAQARLQARMAGGDLLIRNASGHGAQAHIVNAAGQDLLDLTLGENAKVPASALPRGLFFLRMKSVEGESFQAFVR